jgi:DNA-binding NarL/FixJ family response regulator
MAAGLVVEDNLVYRRLLKEALARALPSVKWMEANNAEGAMDCVARACPDLIVTDIRLQGENGLSLAARIKARHPHVRIMVLTNYNFPEYEEEARRCGVDGFLVKGTPEREILRMARSLLFGDPAAPQDPGSRRARGRP